MSDIIEITATPRSTFILVEGVGMWTVDQVMRHFHNLDREVYAMRVRNGRVRVLADMSRAQVQTAEVARLMTSETARIYREHDRVAVIVATKLVAIQIKRTSRLYDLQTFEDRSPALAWLASEAPSAFSPGA
ncbi:MAG: STAS/SEC14 domain-containing protein [Sphingobium sp.]|nr:STAS/SEC14 domain-containing protein [Sphingobium sp.]